MALVHSLAAFSRGNLVGVQSTQRDWSPFLAHFTTWSAMSEIRSVVRKRRSVREIAELLDQADSASWLTMQKILTSTRLIARSPSQKDQIPPCVCLSECTLPGLISHCERYGRFGLVFSKADVYRLGGRPCLYLAEAEYAALARFGRGKTTSTAEGRLFALANVYVPPKATNKIQDFSHEREWRVFGDVEFGEIPIVALLAPSGFAGSLNALAPGIPIVPIDTLFDWGA
jgi:hypothetical protein